MAFLNGHTQQAINRNSSSVIDFLERKFRRTKIYLPEVPSYFYKGSKSKLEIAVHTNPQVGKIDVRIIGMKNYDREPAYERSYDLNGLSVATFQRDIENLLAQMS